MLENEIVPLFYRDSEQEIPVEWARRMKACMANITPRFSCGRMVAEYMSELYQPAHDLWMHISGKNFEQAREKTLWDSRMSRAWDLINLSILGTVRAIMS